MKYVFTFMSVQKLAVAAVAGILALGVTVATFASQDGAPGPAPSQATVLQEDEPTATPTDVVDPDLTSTPESEETATPTPEDELTPTPEDEQTPTPTPADDVTPTPEDGEDDEGGQREIVGIPDDNPSHQPEDGDGVCEKGETVVKTTRSGKQVNVPCQAATPGSGKDHKNNGDESDDGEDGEE